MPAPAKGKAPPTVAERHAAPHSSPLFAVDWSKFTSKEAFLAKTTEVFWLDPNSAEGFNCHVSSYYYVSADWGTSHPQSHGSIMLKNDSRQSHRWTCVHCMANQQKRGLCTGGSIIVTPGAGHGATQPPVLASPPQRYAKQLSTLVSLWSLCQQALPFICSPMRCQVTPKAWTRGSSSLRTQRH